MRSVAILLAAAFLAGCSETAPDEAPPLASVASQSTRPAPIAPPPPEPQPMAFTWSGHTKEGAWVCMEQDGLGQCPVGQQLAPDGQHVKSLAYAGNLTALVATMAWQADATQAGLVLAAYGNRSGSFSLLGAAQGPSPLMLRLDTAGAGLVADGALVLMVWPQGKTPTSPSVFLDVTQQPFTVEGTLWQLAGPASPSG